MEKLRLNVFIYLTQMKTVESYAFDMKEGAATEHFVGSI